MCLAKDAPQFLNKMFDMAKSGIKMVIDTVKGWVENTIGWALDKIKEMWDGITGACSLSSFRH